LRIPGGTVRASGYDSQHHDLVAAIPTGGGFLEFDAGLTRTRDAGTAALPMDMIEADSWHAGLRHRAALNCGTLESRISIHDIDHLMDNFSLRPAPAAPLRMEAPSTSRDYGLRSDLTMPRGGQVLRLGIDLHRNEFDADQVQSASGLRRDMFADNRRHRLGAYGEWENAWTPEWTSLLGVRIDYVSTAAGVVRPGFGPPAVAADAAAFNSGKRSHDDLLADFVAGFRFTPDEASAYEVSLGVKNRAPSLLERYLWTPLNASAGLADGRTYLGNPALDPETSFQLAASASRRGDRWQWRLTPFYNHVHDFIQGSPIGRIDPAGRPVLQFRNFDRVDLYGAEFEGRFEFTDQLSMGGHLSHVRGRNHSTGDNLYRISPLHGLLDLAWRDGAWEGHLEVEWAADQNKVSAFNDETPSPGYALLHLRGAHRFENGVRIELGIENLLDESYAPHLGGVNRVTGSDVAVGRHIPGAGRFGYASLSWKF
jgi:iron complex outermembrane receptor protein